MFRKFTFILVTVFIITSIPLIAFTQDYEDDLQEDIEERVQEMDKKLEEEYEKPAEIIIEEIIEAKRPKPSLPTERISISDIQLTGATVLVKEIDAIISQYKNQALSGAEMQKCADAISETYKNKGYLTSYAYIISDKINQGILEIRAVEGKVGEIEIKGNRYFKTEIYEKKMTLEKGFLFNSLVLQQDIYRINKSQDRKVRFLLKRGKAPGTVDIVLLVNEKWPFHTIGEVDNYGSWYILEKRYKLVNSYNNLTGHDDTLMTKAQVAEAGAQTLFDTTYNFPVTNDLRLELYLMPKKKEVYFGEREDIDMCKRAQKYIFTAYYTLTDKPNLESNASLGFVWKDLFWHASGGKQKWDRFRAIMMGFDWNRADKFGRTVFWNDFEIGIPELWQASSHKDINCSVRGAGGKYIKDHFYLMRRQKLVKDVDLLIKTQAQFTDHVLTGVNMFSAGGGCGVTDVRGYPRTEAVGDSGSAINIGLEFPSYFIPKDIVVPFSKGRLYDALKLFILYDWANARKKSPKEDQGEEKSRTIKSVGWGFKFRLPENFSCRFDMAWPLDHHLPKDGDHTHIWWKVTKAY